MGNRTREEKRRISVDPLYSPRAATIVKTGRMTENEKFFELRFDDRKPLGQQPGQFVQLSILGIGEAPISVSSSPTRKKKDSFEICVRKVGAFTNALHRFAAGDKIGVRGPFGRAFPVEEMKGNDLLFVAGGLGIIPLRSLINFVIDKRRDFGKVTILLGCKTPADMLFTDEMKRWEQIPDVDYAFTVDRADAGWEGNVGVITTLIPGAGMDADRTYAVVAGPHIMYKFVLFKLFEKGIPERQIILSLERRMKCGVGKCGHCQMNHIYVCKEGPVFSYAEIKELPEAL